MSALMSFALPDCPGTLQGALLRRISIIALGVALALALHQIGSDLVDCLRTSDPDPFACDLPEIMFPHTTDTEDHTPGQLPPISQFVLTSTTSISTFPPCFRPGSKQSPS